jgi:hypothetical protein
VEAAVSALERVERRELGGRRGIGQIRILGREPRDRERAVGELAQRARVEPVGGGGARSASDDHAQRERVVARGHVLMDLVVRETREARLLGLENRLGLIGVRHRQALAQHTLRLLGESGGPPARARGLERRAMDRAAHERAPTPTCTSRKRVEDAPCAVRMVWLGWPLPQLGVPQISQS